MLSKDFYGKNGFVWWTGIVENDEDPLKLGSVQVRIIGIHNEDKNLVPTDSLPWAQVIMPANGSSTNAVPRPGDWVIGFFQDGDYAQMPVVLGVYSGIESSQSQTIYREVTIKRGSSNVPKPSQFDRAIGEPTTARMSRGVMEGTLTGALNKRLSHACDVKEPVKAAITWARLQNSTLMQALTATLKGLTASKGADPTGLIKLALDTLKKIQTFLKWIQSLLQTIQDYAYIVIEYAKIARAVLDYINSLPNRLREFIRACLSQVASGIMAVVSALFSTSGLGDTGFGELKSEFDNTLGELTKTFSEVGETLSLPGQFVEALVNPSSAQAQSAAEKEMSSFIQSNTSNAELIHNQTVYNKTNFSSP
jgi:hypothetical protein